MRTRRLLWVAAAITLAGIVVLQWFALGYLAIMLGERVAR